MILLGNRDITEATELKLVIEVTYYLTGVLIKKGKYGHRHTEERQCEDTRGKDHQVIRVMHLQVRNTKGRQQTPEEARNGSPLEPLQKARPC